MLMSATMRFERPGRVRGEALAPEQAELLAGGGEQDHGAPRRARLRGQRVRDREELRDARRVVDGAVADRAARLDAEVVEMGAQHHGLALETWIRPVDLADHVRRGNVARGGVV